MFRIQQQRRKETVDSLETVMTWGSCSLSPGSQQVAWDWQFCVHSLRPRVGLGEAWDCLDHSGLCTTVNKQSRTSQRRIKIITQEKDTIFSLQIVFLTILQIIAVFKS